MLGLKTFRGGIHPTENKHLTRNKPVENMPLPQKVIIPLLQHTGAICEPLVKTGDIVKEYQKIGESKAVVSSPVHASISGTVISIEPSPHPVIPTNVMSIIIEKTAENTATNQANTQKTDWKNLNPQEILNKIKEAGVVGLGGAAFPTHIKLSPPSDKKIDALILNGAECEPFLTNDHALMLEKTQEIIEGLQIILKVLGINKAFIGIESNKKDVIKKMKDILTLCTPSDDSESTSYADSSEYPAPCTIKVMPLKVKYPQGAEKQLIKAILNKEVPSGKLPFDVGAIVQNVATAYAIYEAVALDKPLVEKIITVSGDAIKEPKNIRVKIGTPISKIIEFCGGFKGDVAKIIMGGPMMGISQYTLDVPIIKGTSGIIALSPQKEEVEGPCIKCGHCVDICPMGLMPNRIADYAEKDMFDECKEYGILDCMECGACAYSCASRRPIVHLVKYVKSKLKK